MKPLKLIIAIILLPTIVAVTRTLYWLMTEHVPPANAHPLFSPLTLGFIGGLLLLFFLPRPIQTYVLGHELTHALWGILMGARIGKIKVSKRGGHVELSKTNFLISLAPYFFPFYTTLVIVIYCLISLFFSVEAYHKLFLSLVGITWAFHLYFTIQMVMTRQPDITQNGHIFSFIIIYNLNLIILVVGGSAWVQAHSPIASNICSTNPFNVINGVLNTSKSSPIKSKPTCASKNGKNLFRKC